MTFNDEDKQQLVNTIDYGLMQDMIRLIINFCIKTKKLDVLVELREMIKHFYAGLNEEELAGFKSEVEQMVTPKMEQFRKELGENYAADEVTAILEEYEKSSAFLKGNEETKQ